MRRMASEIPPNIRLELARLQTATDRGDTAEQESAKAAMGKLISELPDKKKQKVVTATQAVVIGVSKKAMAKIDEEKAAMEIAMKRKAIEEKVAAAKAEAAEQAEREKAAEEAAARHLARNQKKREKEREKKEQKKQQEKDPAFIAAKVLDKVEELRKKGNAAMQQGELEAALACYTEALALEPLPDEEKAKILGNRSAAFMAKEEWALGLKDAEAAAALLPESGKAHYRVAAAREACNDVDGAITAVRKALILMPGAEEVEGKLRSLEAKATLAKAEADKKAKAAEREAAAKKEAEKRASLAKANKGGERLSNGSDGGGGRKGERASNASSDGGGEKAAPAPSPADVADAAVRQAIRLALAQSDETCIKNSLAKHQSKASSLCKAEAKFAREAIKKGRHEGLSLETIQSVVVKQEAEKAKQKALAEAKAAAEEKAAAERAAAERAALEKAAADRKVAAEKGGGGGEGQSRGGGEGGGGTRGGRRGRSIDCRGGEEGGREEGQGGGEGRRPPKRRRRRRRRRRPRRWRRRRLQGQGGGGEGGGREGKGEGGGGGGGKARPRRGRLRRRRRPPLSSGGGRGGRGEGRGRQEGCG